MLLLCSVELSDTAVKCQKHYLEQTTHDNATSVLYGGQSANIPSPVQAALTGSSLCPAFSDVLLVVDSTSLSTQT